MSINICEIGWGEIQYDRPPFLVDDQLRESAKKAAKAFEEEGFFNKTSSQKASDASQVE